MKKTIFILLEIVMLTIFSACCKWDAVSENFQNGYTYTLRHWKRSMPRRVTMK